MWRSNAQQRCPGQGRLRSHASQTMKDPVVASIAVDGNNSQ
jgi:hypothetical protein